MVMRKNKMLGQGRGYYNYAPMRAYDRRVHSDSARGRRQPQQMPFMPINPALRKYSNVKLQEGTIKEHMEHPKLTMEQARMIALDHLKYNPRAYGKNKNAQLVNQIMDYESGQMNDKQTLKFFSEITKSGLVWQLQGSYGRTAMALVNEGFMDRQGNLSKKATDFIADYKGGKGGYLLDTQYDSRKSFYGKADVRQEGNKLILKSYNTDVAYIQDGRAVVKGTYSPTTLRHIKEFLRQNGFKADSAKQIMKDYGAQRLIPQISGKLYKAKVDVEIDGKNYKGDVKVDLPDRGFGGGGKIGKPIPAYLFVDKENPRHIEYIKFPTNYAGDFDEWVKKVEKKNGFIFKNKFVATASSTKGGKLTKTEKEKIKRQIREIQTEINIATENSEHDSQIRDFLDYNEQKIERLERKLRGGKAYKAKIDINIDGKKYLGDVDVKLPEQNLLGGKKLLVHRKAYEREPYTRKGNIHVKGVPHTEPGP